MMSHPNAIPLHIEAASKEELSQKMLANNVEKHAHFKYFDIQKDGKKWVAWFYAMVDPLEKKISGIK